MLVIADLVRNSGDWQMIAMRKPENHNAYRGIPSAHMHWDSISDLATLGMWADPGSYAWYAAQAMSIFQRPVLISDS